MDKAELLRDVGIIGALWASVLSVVFLLPDVAVATKYELAIIVSIGTVVAFPIYFGWDKIRARPSLAMSSVIGIIAIGMMMGMAYFIDSVALLIRHWYSVNGVLIVTWIGVLATVRCAPGSS